MDQPDLGHNIARLVLQLGTILIVAKLGAELAERLRLPAVLGELVAGVVIGPFALGGLPLPLVREPLFGGPSGAPVSPWAMTAARTT